MKKRRIISFFLLVSMLVSLIQINVFPAQGNNIYVYMIGGNDSNLGTTPSQPLKNIETAFKKAEDGDTIYIMDMYTFQREALIGVPNKKITITSMASTGEIIFRNMAVLQGDIVFKDISLSFLYLDEDGGRAIYANGYDLTIGNNVDTNYQQGIKYPIVYGGSPTENLNRSPNITLISGQFEKVIGGGYNSYTVQNSEINLASYGSLKVDDGVYAGNNTVNPPVVNISNNGIKTNKIDLGGNGTVNFLEKSNINLEYPIQNADEINIADSSKIYFYEAGSISNIKRNVNVSNACLDFKHSGNTVMNAKSLKGDGILNFNPKASLEITGEYDGNFLVTQLIPEENTVVKANSESPTASLEMKDASSYTLTKSGTYPDPVTWKVNAPAETYENIYVNGEISNSGDGTSEDKAFKFIEDAISKARTSSADYAVIYICGNTEVKTNELEISCDVKIYGKSNAELTFSGDNPVIKISDTANDVTLGDGLNFPDPPDLNTGNTYTIVKSGSYNTAYGDGTSLSELTVRGGEFNKIQNYEYLNFIGYGSLDNFKTLPETSGISSMYFGSERVSKFEPCYITIESDIIESNISSSDGSGEKNHFNFIQDTTIEGNLGVFDTIMYIQSGKSVNVSNQIYFAGDLEIGVNGNPDDGTYLSCRNFNGSGNVVSLEPDKYTFSNTANSAKFVLKRNSSYEFPIESIKLGEKDIYFYLDNIFPHNISYKITPSYAKDDTLVWESSDERIAKVNQYGLVKPLSEGKCIITLKNSEGKYDTCTVYVVKKFIPIENITLDKTELNLNIGEVGFLVPSITPEDASNNNIEWQSDNPSIAFVADGTVIALSEGTANITAISSKDSSKKASCKVTVTKADNSKPVESVLLNKNNTSLFIGESETLTAVITPSDATNQKVTWSSSDESIASVSNDGTVTAKLAGNVVISVMTDDGKKVADCNIEVKSLAKVESVSLDNHEITLNPNNSKQLTAAIVPENAVNKNVSWLSSDNGVASVSNTGLVTANTTGSAIITVKTEDGNKTDECKVNVVDPPITVIDVTGISLDKKSSLIKVGETDTLTASITPSNATNKNVSWISSSNEIATVSNGVITGRGEGIASITVITDDGGFSDTCEVTVSSDGTVVPVEKVNLNEHFISLKQGDTSTLTASITPSNATNKNVSWASSNSEIATVENGIVTALSKGTAIITVTANDGNKTDTCTVEVMENNTNIPVESVTLNKMQTVLSVGQKETLKASIMPSNAANKNVSWISSSNEIATVENGVVTALSEGTAIISVITEDGNKTAGCIVDVENDNDDDEKIISVESVSLDKSNSRLRINGKMSLTAIINPLNATNKDVSWASSDDSIASVDNNGIVTAKKVGTAVITVTTKDGSKTADCTINVFRPTESSSSDSSSSGSGSSDSSNTNSSETKTETKENEDGSKTIEFKPDGTTESGKTNIIISKDSFENIISESFENKSNEIIVSPKLEDSTKIVNIEFPEDALKNIGQKTNSDLTIYIENIKIILKNSDLSKLEGNLNLSVDKSDMPSILNPGITAVITKPDGTKEIIKKSFISEGKLIIPIGSLDSIKIIDSGKSFSDIKKGSKEAEAVLFVTARELFAGTSKTEFSPNGNMTRGMFVTVLHNLENNPKSEGTKFSDVASDAYYSNAVAWAAEKNIVSGIGNGLFNPEGEITYEQFAVMIYRYAKYLEFDTYTEENISDKFIDSEEISSWAKDAVDFVYGAGILKADSSGYLNPKSSITRIEVAMAIKNLIEYLYSI